MQKCFYCKGNMIDERFLTAEKWWQGLRKLKAGNIGKKAFANGYPNPRVKTDKKLRKKYAHDRISIVILRQKKIIRQREIKL